MTIVRIIKDWDSPDLKRQTPGGMGIWNEVRFTTDPVEKCDYVIVLNHARDGEVVTVNCPPSNIWALIQEPPNEFLEPMHHGIDAYRRIYTTSEDLRGNRFVQSQTALPWHVEKDYDFLLTCKPPVKERDISCITSSLTNWGGRRARVEFLERIRGRIPFDLYGRGFTYIDDKWDALAPYRYSIAIENYRTAYYWTEKIADCFLSWTMPIYCGCTKISQYFPEESMLCVEIDDPVSAIEKIKEALAQERWKKNLDAIKHARELILNKYQFFPFITSEINKGQGSRLLNVVTRGKAEFSGYNRIPPTSARKDQFSLLNRILSKLTRGGRQ